MSIKNSADNRKNGRYTLGGVSEVSSFAIEYWSRGQLDRDRSDIVYVMEEKYEGRLDRLGSLFYGDSGLWWVIGQYNGITDPFRELVVGKVLLIPLIERVRSELFANASIGGITSTRK